MNDRYLKNKLDCIEKKLCNDSGSNLEKLQTQANDLVTSFSYLDVGSSTDRRVSTISYSSTSLGITATEVFTYGGAPGDYYVTKIEIK
jgi:hypothetical protein